jgi:N-acetylglucosaminyldiphosphoundecaprenol N-acetyl-beta-D-mannosaminyltransferase
VTKRSRSKYTPQGIICLVCTTRMRPNVFGIDFDPIDRSTLISTLLQRIQEGKPSYVVTAHLLHVLCRRNDAQLRLALTDAAALVVADGQPILWMARLRGIKLPLVTGSDLMLPLCRAAAREGRSIFLFGTTFDALTECGRRLSSSIDGLRIAGIYSPPFGFERSAYELSLAACVIRAAAPDIVLVALGVPKQEIWAQQYARMLNIQAICLGASLDFVAGTQRRAPPIFRRIGCEWLWRMLTEPRRLGIRYLTILCWLPFMVAGDLAAATRRLWTKSA